MTADQLSQLLDELGKRLGPSGAHVFDLAVRQQLIVGVLWTIVGVITLIVGLGMVVMAFLDDYNRDGWALVGIPVVIGGFIFILLSVPFLLNPEYFAIKDILQQVHP